jgi:hypothetical protein
VRTNQIPRAIPAQQWYLHPAVSCLLGGILPFGAVSVELYFIMSALWLHQVRNYSVLRRYSVALWSVVAAERERCVIILHYSGSCENAMKVLIICNLLI